MRLAGSMARCVQDCIQLHARLTLLVNFTITSSEKSKMRVLLTLPPQRHKNSNLKPTLGDPGAVTRDGTKKSRPKSGPATVYKLDEATLGQIVNSRWSPYYCRDFFVPSRIPAPGSLKMPQTQPRTKKVVYAKTELGT